MNWFLDKTAIAPMAAIALMFAISIVPASGHGNNPGNSWVGVNLGGIDFGMEPDVYTIVDTLWPDVLGVADRCAELAMNICGESRVCCYCVIGSNGDESCFFSCQDAEGHCEPCPECNPGKTT